MPLKVDLSVLHLAAAQMQGLGGYLDELRKQKLTYQTGLSMAIAFVKKNDGTVVELEDEQTKLTLGSDEAICFQLYPDIDLFYYEN